jgi:hypothetical protein
MIGTSPPLNLDNFPIQRVTSVHHMRARPVVIS